MNFNRFKDTLRPPAGNESVSEWFTTSRFAVILAVFFFISFADVLLGFKTFVIRDFGFFGYPLAYYHREAFWRGEIPLWNPLSYCGLPFLAQWNSLVCYPLSLIYLIFPLAWSLPVFCIAHLWVAGVGMHRLAENWTGNRLAASVAGLAFAFSGLTLNSLMWPNNCAAFAWMPWLVLFGEQAWKGSRRHLLLSIFAGALQMLAGGPEIILFTWAILGALWVGHLVRGYASPMTLVIRGSAQVAFTCALAAVQLLPFLQLLKVSHRGVDHSDAAWAMPSWGWGNFFVPLFHTYQSVLGPYFQYDQFWTSSYYVAISALLLAAAAILRTQSARVKLLLGLGVFGAIMALGRNGYLFGWIESVSPITGFFRYPIKFVVLPLFVVPLLAAFSVAAIQRNENIQKRGAWTPERLIALVAVAIIGGVLLIAHSTPQPGDNWGMTLQSGLVRIVFIGLGLGVLHLVATHAVHRSRWLAAIAFLVFMWLDVLSHAPRQNPAVDPSTYVPGLAVAKHKWEPLPKHGVSRVMLSPYADLTLRLKSGGTPQDNYLVNRLALYANCNLLENIPKVNGFYSLYPRELFEIVSTLYSSTNAYAPKLADFLSVSRITAPGQFFDWIPWNSHLPMVTAGQAPVFADRDRTFSGMLDLNWDPRASVYLAGESTASSAQRDPTVKILSSRFENHRIEFRIKSSSATWAVISQTHYPCWQASVNDQPVTIMRANHAFQAIPIPAGEPRVILEYKDNMFRLGFLISVLTLLACLIAWKKWL